MNEMSSFVSFMLFRNVYSTALANHHDAHLTGIFHLFLDLMSNVVSENRGLSVRDLVGLNHDMNLAAGLHSIGTLNTLMSIGDLFKLLKTLDVVFSRLTTSARTRRRNGIGGLNQHRENRVRLNVGMVSLDGVNDGGLFTIATSKVGTNHSMRPLDIVIDSLSKVVQKTRAFGGIGINAQLGCHDRAHVRNLERMLEDILAKRSSIAQSTERLDEFGVQIVNTGIERCLFTGLAHTLLNKIGSLVVHLLDAGGMDTTICNQILEGYASSLATNRIEARENNGLRSIVNDKIDARDLLKRTNVTAFATDNPTFEIIGRNVHRSNGGLCRVIGSATLDGKRNDLLSGLVALCTNLLLGFADNGCSLMGNLAANLIEKLAMSVIARQLGNALELGSLLGNQLIKLTRTLFNLTSLARKLMLALIESIITAIEGLLTLHHAVLKRTKLALALLFFILRGLLMLNNLLFSLEKSFFLQRLCRALRIADDGLSLFMGRLNLGVCLSKASVFSAAHGDRGNYRTDNKASDANDNLHAHSSPSIYFLHKERHCLERQRRHLLGRIHPVGTMKIAIYNLIKDE